MFYVCVCVYSYKINDPCIMHTCTSLSIHHLRLCVLYDVTDKNKSVYIIFLWFSQVPVTQVRVFNIASRDAEHPWRVSFCQCLL
jgi:hypothetical protein